MAQVIRSPKTYDVCIIGSGAAGGTAAKILTEGGLNVVMLEAGPPLNPEKDFKEHVWPYQLPHRGAGVGGRASENFSEFLAPNGSWDIEGEPYTVAAGSRFRWFRSRIVGGRTNHWGRIALRFAPVDFKARSSDGQTSSAATVSSGSRITPGAWRIVPIVISPVTLSSFCNALIAS